MKVDYFKRDIYDDMLKWKASLAKNRTALQVQGARQVGKTFIVEKFAKENFKNVVYINLFQEPDRGKAKYAGNLHLNPEDTLKVFFPDFVDSPDTVVIIDEVQEFPHMYNLIRPVVRNMKTNLIVSGSFLGHILNRDYFDPAADLDRLEMRSLSFPEFLGIFDKRDLYENIDLFGGSPCEDYDELRGLYQLYLQVGGHPSVIKKALEEDDLSSIGPQFKRIVSIFCEDSRRYFKDINDALALPTLMHNIADMLLREKRGTFHFAQELLKLNYSTVTKRKAVLNCINWMVESRFISRCGKYTDLKPTPADQEARFYFADVGIANYMFHLTKVDNTNIVGRLAENFVYRTMIDHQPFGDEIPAFATYGEKEIDFFEFVRGQDKVYKVAVKVKNQRTSGGSASSLLKDDKLDYLIYVKGDTYGGKTDKVLTIPIYLFGRFRIDSLIQLVDDHLNIPIPKINGLNLFD